MKSSAGIGINRSATKYSIPTETGFAERNLSPPAEQNWEHCLKQVFDLVPFFPQFRHGRVHFFSAEFVDVQALHD